MYSSVIGFRRDERRVVRTESSHNPRFCEFINVLLCTYIQGPGSGHIVQGRIVAQGRYIRGRIVMGSADGAGRLVFPL
jgi:hypothetical protein